MKKFIITEDEKNDILGQHNDMTPKPSLPENRRNLDINLSTMDLTRLKSQGLTPYYVDGTNISEYDKLIKKSGITFGLHKPKEVFILTQDEYEKVKNLSDKINEIIEEKLKSIELYKQYLPSIVAEMVKKN